MVVQEELSNSRHIFWWFIGNVGSVEPSRQARRSVTILLYKFVILLTPKFPILLLL